jgi:hypothetical protein
MKIALALVLAMTLSPAAAQIKLKPLTGNLANDIKSATAPSSTAPTKPGACDITLFTNLTIATVVAQIQTCVGSVVAGGASPFVSDLTQALASAKTANDGTAVACLTPALAIATAAMGQPGNADATAPVVYPGPITIFQKYREFVTAGGISNCKTAIQSTVAGTVGSAGL